MGLYPFHYCSKHLSTLAIKDYWFHCNICFMKIVTISYDGLSMSTEMIVLPVPSKYDIQRPATYSNMIAGNVIKFIIYTYLSSVTLIRLLTESIRFHIKQDLADPIWNCL